MMVSCLLPGQLCAAAVPDFSSCRTMRVLLLLGLAAVALGQEPERAELTVALGGAVVIESNGVLARAAHSGSWTTRGPQRPILA